MMVVMVTDFGRSVEDGHNKFGILAREFAR